MNFASDIPHDVFISFAQNDKPVAEAVCAKLESRDIRCWMAPRDVPPGEDFPQAIIEGIETSKIIILIFSSHSNKSPHVVRELTVAVNKGLTIVPFRVEDVTPSKSMEYLISVPHWLDAITPPLEEHIEKLLDTVENILKKSKEKKPVTIPSCPQCGSPTDPGQTFCDACGASLSTSVTSEPPPFPPTPSPPPPPPLPSPLEPSPRIPVDESSGPLISPKIVVVIITIIAIIAVLEISGFSGFSLMSSKSAGKASQGVDIVPVNSQCPSSLFLCNGNCVNLQTDPNNCGACGVSISPRMICQNGQQVGSSASSYQTNNLQSPSTYPTLMATTVTASFTFTNPTCPSEQSLCNGACRNLQYDNINCGSCGIACAVGQSCQNGACISPVTSIIPTTFTTMQTLLPTPTLSSAITQNPTSSVPSQTQTITPQPCPVGQVQCMGTCKNLLTDPTSCGICGAFCSTGASCQNGACVKPVTTTIPTTVPTTCTPGNTKCSGICVNLTSDASNCGSCGHVCPTGSYCFRSYCLNFCKPPFCDFCNGVQTDLRYSQSNCGKCGNACTGGTVCTQGQCL